jgi:predicted nucleic acid-binding protein
MTLVDSNILIDLFIRDPVWFEWSKASLAKRAESGRLVIVDIIFSEVSLGFRNASDTVAALALLGIERVPTSAEALHHAAHAFRSYRTAGGSRTGVLPDFLIGAHARSVGIPILTRDTRHYASYFPEVDLIAPR